MQSFARLTGCLSILGLLSVGCGGDDTDPKNAKSGSLQGFWVHEEENAVGGKPFFTVMAFLPDKAFFQETGYEVPEGSSGSVVWTNASSAGPAQVATYEVKNGFLEQSVFYSPAFGPSMYRTELFEVDSGSSFTVESMNDPSGRRTYRAVERCPIESETGFARILSHDCNTYFATASALAFDDNGNLHYTMGMASSEVNPSCPAVPTYGVLGKGCSPARFDMDNAGASSLDIFNGKVYHAWEDGDWNVWLARRKLDEQTWEKLELGKASHVGAGIWVFAGERDDVVVTTGYIESQVRWLSKDFEAVTPVDEDDQPIAGRVLAASRSPSDGSLGILVGGNSTSGFYIAEEGETKFKRVELPHSPMIGWGGGLNLLSKDHAYVGLVEGNVGSNPGGVGGRVLGGNGYFLEWENGEWKEHELGLSSMVLLPQRTTEKFFAYSKGKASKPALYVGRIEGDELVTLPSATDEELAPGGSPEEFRQPVFAVGPKNELALVVEGDVVWVHRDEQPWAPAFNVLKK